MRSLNESEKLALSSLTTFNLEYSLIEPTKTGLKKGIMDATSTIREYLLRREFHDYSSQKKGKIGKVVRNAIFIDSNGKQETKVSLYRPETKSGDPRIWIYSLPNWADANDVIAIFVVNHNFHAINISNTLVKAQLNQKTSKIAHILNSKSSSENAIAEELLRKIRDISKSPIPTEVQADTGVGRTLETLLGIPINSNQAPDYKGIELKAFRARSTRTNLFAKVPNWKLSKLKGSGQILKEFGYIDKKGNEALRCTVSYIRPNSQGLLFEFNDRNDWLVETEEKFGDFAIWEFDVLRKALLKKHAETFWIKTESIFIEEREHFIYSKVRHTKNPQLANFQPLIKTGDITMDHLIAKKSPDLAAKEKGPIFKINEAGKGLLFAEERTYDI
jgi:hypothetical protein